MQKGVSNAAVSAEEWFADRRRSAESAPTRVFNIGDLWNVLRSSRRLIAMTIASTTALALVAGILMPKRYSAGTQLFVDSRSLKILANDVAPQMQAETAVADFESQIKILASGSVLRRVVEREKLATDPTFVTPPGLISRLRALLPGGGSEGAPNMLNVAAAILEKATTIKRSERSFVVDVLVSDKDPVRAARLSNAVAEVYLENQVNYRRDLSKRLSGEISGRLQDLRERGEAAEKRLNDFKSANNLVYSGGALVAEQDLTELNNQLNQARARTARGKARLDQLARLSGNTGTAATAEVLDSPTIVQLRIRLAEANRQAAELRRNLGPLHPEIQAAEARVREANSSIAGEIDRRRSSIRNDYDQALSSERVLARQITELKSKSNDTGQAMIGYRELERAVETNKKIYEEFLLRSRELTETQGIFANGSYIITAPSVPSQPTGLTLPMILAIGFFAGFPAGLGLALVRSQISQSGQMPLSAPTNASASRPLYSSGNDAQNDDGLSAIGRTELETYLGQNCLARTVAPSNSIAHFAQTVESVLPGGSAMALLVVSAGPGAPGAEVTAALAACWAYEGYDVLAVDADADGARLSRIAGLLGTPGLFDRLHRDINELLRWNRKGLPHLLPSLDPGQRRESAGARRIVSQRLSDIVSGADNIILDAGDIGTNPYTANLVRIASAAVIVAGPGEAGREIRAAITKLESARVTVLGVIKVTGGEKPARAAPISKGLSLFRRRPKGTEASEASPAVVKGA